MPSPIARLTPALLLAAACNAGLEPQEEARLTTQALTTAALPPSPTNAHADDPAAREFGRQVFFDPRMSADGRVSCASCHNDGGEDGRVWDFTGFGEGLRNTITLRGQGGTRNGPVHWSGNFDEIQDFENQIRSLPHGTGLITTGDPNPPLGAPNAGRSADLDALAPRCEKISVQRRKLPVLRKIGTARA
jgi:cytochrome c peroxidase